MTSTAKLLSNTATALLRASMAKATTPTAAIPHTHHLRNISNIRLSSSMDSSTATTNIASRKATAVSSRVSMASLVRQVVLQTASVVSAPHSLEELAVHS